MKISLIAPGKLRSSECKALCRYYQDLCSAYAELELIELNLKAKSQEKLEEDILHWLTLRQRKKSGRIVLTLLDERGLTFESRAFAKKVEKIRDSSPTEWIVLLGTDRGLSAEFKKSVKDRTAFEWSLSKMTMAHELALAVACEQLYRAFAIIANHPYHRD